MNLRDFRLRLRALLSPRRVERELDEELAFHIERETQEHVASGLSLADARARARRRFGSVPLAADACRDARGTAFIDAGVRDVLYAFRTFRRAPLTAVTIVATVALGLGLVAVVFTFYNALFLRVDAVPNPGELFEARRLADPRSNAWVPFTRPQYEALRRDTRVFTDAFAMLNSVGARVDGRAMSGTLVTGNFFQVLGVNAALGRTLTPADDERFNGRPVIVLSHKGWTKLFKGDATVIGRTMPLNGIPYEIVGVMPPGFRGLAVVAPDYWVPLALLGQVRPATAGRDDEIGVDVVGRLKPGLSPETATAGLTVWAAGNTDLPPVGRSPKTIRLLPRAGTASADALEGLRRFSPIFFAFGLILMIGCANVANLLLARGVSRQREIGIRLSLGASRRRIIRQLLTESLLLALLSAACGFGISRLVFETAVRLAVITATPEIAELVSLAAPAADWRVVLFLLCGAIVATVFFGLVPAFQATRLELVRTMRGELTEDSRPGRARNALIAVQVGASALLVISAAVFLRSALAAATVKPGVRIVDTVILEMTNEPVRAAMLQAVNTDPSVAGVAALWPTSLRGALAEASVSAEPMADKPAHKTVPVQHQFVSPEYFSLLDIDVVRGRGFTPDERSAGAGVAVVSETTARRLWPDRGAIGQVMELKAFQDSRLRRVDGEASGPQLPFRAFTVVGVVRDVQVGAGAFEIAGAGVYVPVGAESPGTSLVLRVRGDPEQGRQQLIERLTRVDPAIGRIWTLKSIADTAIYVLQTAFWITAVLGGLALVLTLSGIFSVLSYVVEQRRHEIGVRMALGATPRNVTGLVLAQSVRPVVFGLMAGGSLTSALASVLMWMPAAAQIGGMVHVFDPVAYAVSVLSIVTACVLAASIPALRAARIDPMTTLRQD